jgi:hypothetical protein
MLDILDIQNKIKNNVIDSPSYSLNKIEYGLSIIEPNKWIMLHIYNPNNEELIVNQNNTKFFEKVCNMLFNKKYKNQGCFNHQKDDKIYLYNEETTVAQILNHFLQMQYTFILINIETFIPVSLFCLVDNYIYDVCSDFNYRKKGYMTKMLKHFFKLVENNKLKNGRHEEIKLDIVRVNPDFSSVRDYYKNIFKFSVIEELNNKVIMCLKFN